MSIYSNIQQNLAEKISAKEVTASKWTDWHWQLRHSITRLETFERLLGTEFDLKEHRDDN